MIPELIIPAAPPVSRRSPAWLRFFQPAPPIPVTLTEPAAIQESFRRWRWRVLCFSIIGYATFYLVRKNLPMAMPSLGRDLHISKSDLGLFLTLHGVLYGLAKFANGFFGDRCNARSFFIVGLAGSALLNLLFGFGSTVAFFGIVWMLNGWFQGMGFPPCARLLTHWFPPKQLATKMSIWNTSHCIGAIVILLLGAALVKISWRLVFLVPAGIALLCTLLLWFTLPDTPPSVGLPEVEGTESGPASGGLFLRQVFCNKYIWLVSLANFFVYTVRYAVFDWGPTMLDEYKHISITNAAWMLAGFEVFGAIGAVVGGWLTDKWFGGRPMRVGLFFMVLSGGSLLLFWKFSGQSPWFNVAFLCATGFLIYGPQCLIGIAAANLATKRAAATAVGLTGLFGYLSTVLSGWGLGALVQHHGWDAGFAGLLIIVALGTLLFALAWPARAHGYENS
jgi:sugar phosphate permease